ncbi:MAG: hypothetical protein ACO1QS_03515 [Verrucomicrobiota bacterium]
MVQAIFRNDATISQRSGPVLAGGVSCLKTELDRHCAMVAGKLQISAVKGVGIVDANELSAPFPQKGATGQKVNETRTPDARS